jgi:hypothetical protein
MLSPKEQSFRHQESKGELVEETLLFFEIFTGLRTRWIKSRQIESGRRVLTLCS